MSLDTAGSAQRHVGHAVADDRFEVDARVPGARCADEFVQGHGVDLGERQQHLQGRFAAPAFKTGEGALVDPGLLGQSGQRQTVPAAQVPQPRPDRGQTVLLSDVLCGAHTHQHAETA